MGLQLRAAALDTQSENSSRSGIQLTQEPV